MNRNEQPVPLTRNTAWSEAQDQHCPSGTFTNIVSPYALGKRAPGVTELWDTHFPISLKVLLLMPREDGRRCGWRGRDSVPAYGKWCCSPPLTYLVDMYFTNIRLLCIELSLRNRYQSNVVCVGWIFFTWGRDWQAQVACFVGIVIYLYPNGYMLC